MLRKDTLDINALMQDAVRHIVRGAIESSIGEMAGSAIHGDVKEAIKAEAALIMKEPEMQAAIRARIKHWLGNAD